MKPVWAVSLALALCAPRGARAAAFHDVLPGARSAALGGYAAVAEGPETLFHNPAGLSNSDFPQFSMGTGRMLSGLGLLSQAYFVYARPFTTLPGSTVGVSHWTLKQNGVGRKDAFHFHFSRSTRVSFLPLREPVKYGGNFKFMQVKSPKGDKFGIGLDAGILLDAGFGVKTGLALRDMTSDIGVPRPTLTLPVSYRFKQRATFAADFRVRSGLAELFPGVEVDFFQQLLKARVGKGLRLDGASQIAFGLGAALSPFFADFSFSVPWRGFNAQGGSYQVSAAYKFGAPAFSGRFVGSAARRAEELSERLAELESRKSKLEAEVAAAESDRISLEGQVQALELRLKETQQRLRSSETDLDKAQDSLGRVEAAPPAPAQPKPETKPASKPAPAPFPRRHVVVGGETLRSIAKTHYGDAGLWELIYQANPDKVERGLPIEGAVLTIPAPKGE